MSINHSMGDRERMKIFQKKVYIQRKELLNGIQ